MIRAALQVLFGPVGRVLLVGFSLSFLWVFWTTLPQQPVEVVRDVFANYWDRDFGAKVDFGFRQMGQYTDRHFEESDPTWTIKYLEDERLSVIEKGTGRVLSTLPPADYRLPRGSRFGHLLTVQVEEQTQIWDVMHGKLIFSDPDFENKHMTMSGRHLFCSQSNENCEAFDLKVIDILQSTQIVHIQDGMTLTPWNESDSTPIFDRLRWPIFSGDGRLMALEIRDKENKHWLWLWNLHDGRPAQLIPIAKFEFYLTPGADPTFGTSHRYFASFNERQRKLFDFGTNPPSDLSHLVADYPIDYINNPIILTRNRRS